MVCAALVAAGSAFTQEVMTTGAATGPSPGGVVLYQQLHHVSFRNDPRRITEIESITSLAVGILPDLSVTLDVPLVHQDDKRRAVHSQREKRDRNFGFRDFRVTAKLRVYRDDSSALDTTRASLVGGLEIPVGDSEFTNGGFNPVIGGVLTAIRSRHGMNLSSTYTFTTGGVADPVRAGDGTADLLRANASYLYRIAPARYGSDTPGSFYGVMEINGLFETSGDREVFLSPGLMYEGANWAIELSVQTPILQELQHRPRTDRIYGFGLRFLF